MWQRGIFLPFAKIQHMAQNRLFLLDAYALIFRAYYALGDKFLYNSKGLNVTAISVFTDSLYTLLQKEKPTHLAIAFDAIGPTDRSVEFDFYKANRQETPEDIKKSVPIIQEILRAWHIPMIELAGYEADDVIGTIACQLGSPDMQVYMVTPDKDYGQLVSEHVFMYKPPFRGKPEEIYGIPEVLAKWDIERIDQVIDMLALMGDKVDNIPGIPGVGEKTAAKLLKEFGTVENLLANTDQVKGKLREKIEEGKEMAIISKKLATIICNAPIEYDLGTFTLDEPDRDKLAVLFSELEFRTLGKRILGDNYNVVVTAKAEIGIQGNLFEQTETVTAVIEPASTSATIDQVDHQYHLVDTSEKRKALIAKLDAADSFGFDTETTGLDPNNVELVGMVFSLKAHESWYVPVPEDQAQAKKITAEFRHVLESTEKVLMGHNVKYDALVMRWYDIGIAEPTFDTMIAHYVIKPEMKHGLDVLSETYLGYKPIAISELIGPKGLKQGNMRDVPVEKVVDYAGEDTDVVMQLTEKFKPALKELELEKLFYEVEGPMVHVLTKMEFLGVGLNKAFLENYSEELLKEIIEVEESIYRHAGAAFNLNSPRQLGEVLFDRMKLPYSGKKTKTGQYATGEDVLRILEAEHEIIKDILAYRELSKLKSTYVDSLPSMLNPRTGRVHSSFRQAVVPTGRLSSDAPNLQNIPIRTEKGRHIRKAFIPRSEEFVLLSADYSQIELRILASMSGDPTMIEAFRNNEDIHSATASKIFDVPLEEVTREQRSRAKAVNFGLAYGQTAFGLSQTLCIKRTEAKEIIDSYFSKYSGIRKVMDDNIAFAQKHGYVKTILGRRRYLPDINSGNNTVRGFAERNAINSPIQGSAADLIKIAMVNLHREIEKRKLKSGMILQVHDELVFDVHRDEVEIMQELVRDKMTNAIQLNVPLVVDMGMGKDWLEAH